MTQPAPKSLILVLLELAVVVPSPISQQDIGRQLDTDYVQTVVIVTVRLAKNASNVNVPIVPVVKPTLRDLSRLTQ